MRISIGILSTVAVAIGAGCASQSPQSYPANAQARLSTYAEATPCCDDPSGFPFGALPKEGHASAAVDVSSPVFDFHSGVSPFVAFRLPDGSGPYRIRVKSLFDEDDGDEAGVFYPVIALLDDAYIVVHLTGLEHLRLEPALATAGGEAGIAVSVALDPSTQNGRYLVVFTPAALLGAPPESPREGDVLTPTALAWMARRGEAALPASPYGRLRITIAPEVRIAEKSEGNAQLSR